jgi:hypothetical protein
MNPSLAPPVLATAVAAVSSDGAFWYTRRNLMYELVRAGTWPDPGSDPEDAHTRFAAALAAHEAEHGRLERLIRPENASPGLTASDLDALDLPSDLFDYTVRRVVVLDRLDSCLLLITNGLHRKLEVAPVAVVDGGSDLGFPSHVWARVQAQLAAGIPTTFFAVHDCNAAGYAWLVRLREQLLRHEAAALVHVGLSVPWAFRLRLPVRSTGKPADPALLSGPGRDFMPLLSAGSYAELEELRPLQALRWIYRRTARGAEDVGFG